MCYLSRIALQSAVRSNHGSCAAMTWCAPELWTFILPLKCSSEFYASELWTFDLLPWLGNQVIGFIFLLTYYLQLLEYISDVYAPSF